MGRELKWLGEFQMLVLEGAHQIVVKAATLEQSEAATKDDEMALSRDSSLSA